MNKRSLIYLAAVNAAANALSDKDQSSHALETKQLEAFNAVNGADPRDYELFKSDFREARDRFQQMATKKVPSEKAAEEKK